MELEASCTLEIQIDEKIYVDENQRWQYNTGDSSGGHPQRLDVMHFPEI